MAQDDQPADEILTIDDLGMDCDCSYRLRLQRPDVAQAITDVLTRMDPEERQTIRERLAQLPGIPIPWNERGTTASFGVIWIHPCRAWINFHGVSLGHTDEEVLECLIMTTLKPLLFAPPYSGENLLHDVLDMYAGTGGSGRGHLSWDVNQELFEVLDYLDLVGPGNGGSADRDSLRERRR
jgi:hypothetical protein